MVSRELNGDRANQSPRMEMDSESFKEYVGIYRHTHVDLEVSTDGKSLLLSTPDAADQEFYPVAEDFFVHEMMDIQLSFARDDEGTITKVIVYQRGETLEAVKAP